MEDIDMQRIQIRAIPQSRKIWRGYRNGLIHVVDRYGEDVETGYSTEQIEMKWIEMVITQSRQIWRGYRARIFHEVDRYGEDIETGNSTEQIKMERIQRRPIPRNRYKWRGYRDGQFHGHCDLKFSRSQAKIDENFANYFLKPTLTTSAIQ